MFIIKIGDLIENNLEDNFDTQSDTNMKGFLERLFFLVYQSIRCYIKIKDVMYLHFHRVKVWQNHIYLRHSRHCF